MSACFHCKGPMPDLPPTSIAKYCSAKCRIGSRNGDKPTHLERHCELCGVVFTYHRSQKRRFCGYECKTKAKIKDQGTGVCPVCKKEFSVAVSKRLRGRGIYCGMDCSLTARQKMMKEKEEARKSAS